MLKYSVKFPGDSVFTSLDHLVRHESVSASLKLFNDSLKSVIDTFSFSIKYDQSIFNKFYGADEKILCEIKTETDNPEFAGVISPELINSIGEVVDSLPVTVHDNSWLLDEELKESFEYPATIGGDPFYILSKTNPESSIIHKLLESAGYTVPTIFASSCPDILTTIQHISGQKGEGTYREILDTLLLEHGYVLKFIASGEFTVVQWDRDSLIADHSLDGNFTVNEKLRVNKSFWPYDGIKLSWNTLDMMENALLYRENLPVTVQNDEITLPGKDIAAGDYFPKDGDIKDSYQDFRTDWLDRTYLLRESRLENENISLVSSKDHICSFTADGGVVKDTEIYEPKRSRILFQNTNTEASKIYDMEVHGTALYRKSIEEVLVPTTPLKPLPFQTTYIFNETQALRFAIALKRMKKYGSWNYTFTVPSDRAEYELGDILYIQQSDPIIDTNVIIRDKSYDDETNLIHYTAIGITVYASEGTIVTSTSTSIPAQTEQASEASVIGLIDNGYNSPGGGTTTPEAPTLVGVAGLRTASLKWTNQKNLRWIDYYQIQISNDESTWYRLGSGSSWNDGPGYTTAYSEEFNHNDIPPNGTEANPTEITLYYRVRSVTWAGVTGSWSNTISLTIKLISAGDIVQAAISEAKLAIDSVTETKIKDDEISSPKMKSNSVLTQKLSVLAADLINNPTRTGVLNGWGVIDEEGDGTLYGLGTASVTGPSGASITAMTIDTSSNWGIRSRTFRVDHSKIYKVSMWVKKQSAVGLMYMGIASFETEYVGYDAGSNAQGLVSQQMVRPDRSLYGSPGVNNYMLSAYAATTSWVEVVSYIIGAHADVNDFPEMRTAAYATQLVEDCKYIGIRILNWSNTGSNLMYIASPTVTEYGGGVVVAEQIKALAVITEKLATDAVTADKISSTTVSTLLLKAAELWVGYGGPGSQSSPSIGDRRVFINGNEFSFQEYGYKKDGTLGWTTANSIVLNVADVNGIRSAFINCKGLVNSLVIDFSSETFPSSDFRLFNFENTYDDHHGVDDWDYKTNTAFSTAQKKFGSYSLFATSGNSGSLQGPSNWTIGSSFAKGCYIYPTSIGSTPLDLLSIGGGSNYFNIGISSTQIILSVYKGGTLNTETKNIALTLNNWHLIGLVYVSSTDDTYLVVDDVIYYISSLSGTWGSGTSFFKVVSANGFNSHTRYVDEVVFSLSESISAEVFVQHYTHDVAWNKDLSSKDIGLVPDEDGHVVIPRSGARIKLLGDPNVGKKTGLEFENRYARTTSPQECELIHDISDANLPAPGQGLILRPKDYVDATHRAHLVIEDGVLGIEDFFIDRAPSYPAGRINNTYGHVEIGPRNTSYCHYYTDRPAHYFYQSLYSAGHIAGSGSPATYVFANYAKEAIDYISGLSVSENDFYDDAVDSIPKSVYVLIAGSFDTSDYPVYMVYGYATYYRVYYRYGSYNNFVDGITTTKRLGMAW